MASSFTFLSSIISFVCKASVSQQVRCQNWDKIVLIVSQCSGDRNITEGQFILRSGKICLRITHVLFKPNSSLSADPRFHTKTSGRFMFTWYCCKISYRSEILTPVQQLGWTQASVTHMGMTFCGGII